MEHFQIWRSHCLAIFTFYTLATFYTELLNKQKQMNCNAITSNYANIFVCFHDLTELFEYCQGSGTLPN